MPGRLALAAVAALALAGCRSPTSAAPHPPAPTIRVACREGSVSVSVSESLLVLCGGGMRVVLTGAALRQVGTDDFVGVAAGTATIALTGEPVCSPGTLCPQYRVTDGLITVTVR